MVTEMTLANGDSSEFFTAAAEGRLVLQKCIACSKIQYPPRFHCASCWETNLEWVESSGKGQVETFTVVERAPVKAFGEKVPYVIAAILVDEGPRFITNLTGDDALSVSIGDPVEVVFERAVESDDVLPLFKRV